MPLSHRVRSQFRSAVVGAVGARTKLPLKKETPQSVQALLHPTSKGGPRRNYPLWQFEHEKSKMPHERLERFVSMESLTSHVAKRREVAQLLKTHPELKSELTRTTKEALRERAMKAGKEIWQRAPPSYIQQIVAAGKKNPNLMNVRAGEIISQRFGTAIRPRTILDIGTFSGGTVLGVINKLSPEQRKLTNVVLVDVNSTAVKKGAIPQLIAAGVPAKNITFIPAGFYSAAVAFKQINRPLHEANQHLHLHQFKKLIGKVDAITAGAATINFAVDLKPYLQSIKTLLKPGGTFVNWDWGSAEMMRPIVNPRALKKTPIGYMADGKVVTYYDAYVSFMNFWLQNTLNYPPSVVTKFITDLNASTKFSSFEWMKKNASWAEQQRKTQEWTDEQGKKHVGKPKIMGPLPIKNRAYRTPSSLYRAATSEGLHADHALFPFAKPGELNTGNVNWMMVMTKK